jgi:hypothetical protein
MPVGLPCADDVNGSVVWSGVNNSVYGSLNVPERHVAKLAVVLTIINHSTISFSKIRAGRKNETLWFLMLAACLSSCHVNCKDSILPSTLFCGYLYIMGRTDDIINVAGHRCHAQHVVGVAGAGFNPGHDPPLFVPRLGRVVGLGKTAQHPVLVHGTAHPDIVAIGIAAADRQHTGSQHIGNRVPGVRWIASVGN